MNLLKEDFEYKECLNPIIAELPLYKVNSAFLFFKYQYEGSNKLKIIGNLKKLSLVFNNYDLKKILSRENVIRLPCRKCVNCQLKKARQWSIRNILESRGYDDGQIWFVTLTYDKENIDVVNKDKQIFSLNYIDVQNFMKRLRKKFVKDKIRFFCAGEYGSKTLRPHYHMIIYGLSSLKNSDFEILEKNGDIVYYRCCPIQECWQKGITVTSKFIENQSTYVSQYTTKKIVGNLDVKLKVNDHIIRPEFIAMSRNPGIAGNYYKDHKEEFYVKYNDTLLFHTDFKTFHIKPFEYFDRLYDLENPVLLHFFKNNRKSYGRTYDFFEHYDFKMPIVDFLEDCNRKRLKKVKEREYGKSCT